jgi:hypothetical protein
MLCGCGKKTPLSLKAYEPPKAPRNLTAIQRQDEIVLSWQWPQDRLVRFRVEKKIDGKFRAVGSTTDTSYAEKADVPALLVYRVRAVSEADVAGEPAVISVQTAEPPPAPQGLSFEISGDYVILRWGPSPEELPKEIPEEIRYDVYGKSEEVVYKRLNAEPLKVNEYRGVAEPYKAVTYRIVALKPGLTVVEGGWAEAVVRPADFMPSRAARPVPAPVEEGLMLIWQENPESWITGYRVYRAVDGKTELVGTSRIPAFRYRGETRGGYQISAVGPEREGPLSDTAEFR